MCRQYKHGFWNSCKKTWGYRVTNGRTALHNFVMGASQGEAASEVAEVLSVSLEDLRGKSRPVRDVVKGLMVWSMVEWGLPAHTR